LIIKELIEQIEGEAELFFDMKDDKVTFATIAFANFRGMESILENKHALDALVYTPRVCGICGHSHLLATVRALENAYKNAGKEIFLSNKVQKIREFTLTMEIVQNHFKWIYLTIIPQLQNLIKSEDVTTPLKGAFASNIASKAISIFAGQWPHSSYMIAGGITCDPTNVDILKAHSYLDELIAFFEKETAGVSLDRFLAFESCKDFKDIKSDIASLEKNLIDAKMDEKGFAYDRFLVLGEHSFSQKSKIKKTRSYIADEKYVDISQAYTPYKKSFAYNAHYKNEYYETGPLARMMALSFPIVKNMHRRFKDSTYSRVMARVFELAYLLKNAKQLLLEIDIEENSFFKPIDITKITAKGEGVVEAPRGPLIHRINVEKWIIKDYTIITPTQFNIGSSTPKNLTPVQKAMINATKDEATFIFRSFDVCSVCTTH